MPYSPYYHDDPPTPKKSSPIPRLQIPASSNPRPVRASQPVGPARLVKSKQLTNHVNHRIREMLVIIATLAVAAGLAGGGYLLANRIPLSALGANSTPVATLKANDALNQIQKMYPGATISVAQPLKDEVDLLTTKRGPTDTILTPAQVTTVLSLYMRGYNKQNFWRWVDLDYVSRTAITYEVHASELWVIHTDISVCSSTWTVYAIVPDEILSRGAASTSYMQGIEAKPGSGKQPTSQYISC
jgi:hypothetical protein